MYSGCSYTESFFMEMSIYLGKSFLPELAKPSVPVKPAVEQNGVRNPSRGRRGRSEAQQKLCEPSPTGNVLPLLVGVALLPTATRGCDFPWLPSLRLK